MAAAQSDPGRTRRYRSKRDAIMVAATELLNAHGVRGFTLGDVAQRVGLNTPSVSYYFRKKEDLAAVCLLRSMERIGALVELAAKGRSARERLSILIEAYFDMRRRIRIGEEGPMTSFNEVRAFKAPHDKQVLDAYIELFRAVRRLLDEQGDRDAFRRRRTAHARLAMELLMWSPAILINYEADEFARARRRFADVLLDGLAAPGQAWRPRRIASPPPDPDPAREAFLVAATAVINEQGYRGASVEKISARLNVTKGSFYHHNEAKDDLVVACFERALAVIRFVERTAALEETGWARLCTAADALLRFQLSDRGPILRLTAIHGLPARTDLVAQFDRVCDRFAAVISEGIADGSIRPVDPIVASQMFAAMLNSSAGAPAWIADLTADEFPALYAKPLLTGFFAP